MQFVPIQMNREFIRQTAKYIAWGLTSSMISYSCYLTLTRFFDLYFFPATMIASFFANTFSFFTNKRYVFTVDQKHGEGGSNLKPFIEFLSTRLLSCMIESGLLIYFIEKLGMFDITVKIVSGIIFGVLNYLYTKLVVFEDFTVRLNEYRRNRELHKSAMLSSLRQRWSIRYL